MSKKVLIVSFLLLLHASSSFAEIDELLNMLPSDKKKMILAALNFVPAKQREGIADYLAVIGVVSDGTQNKGFKNFNQNLLKSNSCVQELAANFYREIAIQDLDLIMKGAMSLNSLGKPSLATSVKDFGLQPGWLWQKALNFAKGDQLLAMQLIGLCGHDDVAQFDGAFRMKFENAIKGKGLSYSDSELKSKITEMLKSSPTENKKFLEEMGGASYVLENLKKTVDFKNGVTCPASLSAMYYSQALGEKYDLSPSLKDRIASIQAPTKGKAFVPSKDYHIMGAAYSSCFLVRKDMPNFISERIVKGAINAYRSSRICDKLANTDSLEVTEPIDQVYKDLIKTRENFETCYEKINYTDAISKKEFPYWVLKSKNTPFYCYAGNYVNSVLLKDPDVTNEILIKKVSRRVAEYDVKRMFRNSKFYGAANHCTGEHLGTAVRSFLEKNSFSKNAGDCGLGIEKKRCEAARKVMETYLVDFEWSEAQHLVGFQFAKDHCPSMKPGKNLNQVACNALGKAESKKGTPSGAKPANGVR